MDGQGQHPQRGVRAPVGFLPGYSLQGKPIPHFGDPLDVWHLWTCSNLGFIRAGQVEFQGIYGMNRGRCQSSSFPFPSLFSPGFGSFAAPGSKFQGLEPKSAPIWERGRARVMLRAPKLAPGVGQTHPAPPQRGAEIHRGNFGKKIPPLPTVSRGKRGWEQPGPGAFAPTAAAGNERNRLGIISRGFLTSPLAIVTTTGTPPQQQQQRNLTGSLPLPGKKNRQKEQKTTGMRRDFIVWSRGSRAAL